MKTEVITSVQNPRIKAVARLRERRGRGKEGKIIIDGRREISLALEGGVRLQEVFYCPTLTCGRPRDVDRGILQPAEERGARLTKVSEAVFAKIGYGDRAEGIVATAARPKISLKDLRLSAFPLIGVVEGVEKPGNLGAVLRSADGAGVEAVLAVDPVTDVYGPNVIRSSLGTIFCVPVVEVTADEAIKWLQDQGIAIAAASPAADKVYTELDLTGPVALVFGCEAGGLTATWDQGGVVRAKVPMRGRADSLNVSIAAALFFYEVIRQRAGEARNQPPGTGDRADRAIMPDPGP